jgi:hypothetical protein
MFLLITLMLLQAPPEIRPSYLCTGKAVNGEYEVILDIEKAGEGYKLTWRTNEVKLRGMGVRKGNYLAVLFVDKENRGGVILYHITPVSMEGSWTGGNGQETCTLGQVSRA